MIKTALFVSAALVITACGSKSATDNPAYSGAAALGSFCDRLPRAANAKLSKHSASNDWFEVYEMAPGVFAIYEPFQWQEVISYLITGDAGAALFDTGNGLADIKAITDQLTDKPITVINSHGHVDHIGGNYQFENIISVATDFTIARAKGVTGADVQIEASPEALCKPLPNAGTRAGHKINPFAITEKINDGHIIDLGTRQLKVLRVPGHTDDAIALLDEANGFLWTGDSYYPGPIWLMAPETDLAAYRASVARMAALVPKLTKLFPAHNEPQDDPQRLVELRENLDLVLFGKAEFKLVSDGNVEFPFENFSFLMRGDYNRLSP